MTEEIQVAPHVLARQRRWMAASLTLGAGCVVVAVAVFLLPKPTGRMQVSGRIVFGGRPLPRVEVFVDGHERGRAITGGFGEFTLNDVPVGCVTLIARREHLTAGFPIVVPANGPVDLGLLPMHTWRPLPGNGEHGDQPELGDLWLSSGSPAGS